MRIAGGVAGNVVPDECVVTVNFRFAPDRDVAAAEQHVREVFDGFDVVVTDAAPGALPGLHAAGGAEFVAATGDGAGRQVRLDRRRPVRRAGHPGASTTAPATRTSRTPGRSTSTCGSIVDGGRLCCADS